MTEDDLLRDLRRVKQAGSGTVEYEEARDEVVLHLSRESKFGEYWGDLRDRVVEFFADADRLGDDIERAVSGVYSTPDDEESVRIEGKGDRILCKTWVSIHWPKGGEFHDEILEVLDSLASKHGFGSVKPL
jgi:hypothetical protein